MRIEATAVLAAILVGVLSLAPPAASESAELSLAIPGETPISGAGGVPVLIAGVWHQLAMSLDAPIQKSMTLRATSQVEPGPGMKSSYEWVRDETGDSWTDPLYDTFILPEQSQSDGQNLLFHLGLDAAAVPGPWDLEVFQDGSLIATQQLEVRSPQIGYGLSAADFNFRFEPFQGGEVFSEDLGQYLRVINQGNVPLRLDVSFNKLQNRLSLVNPAGIVHVYQDERYYLKAVMDPRPRRSSK